MGFFGLVFIIIIIIKKNKCNSGTCLVSRSSEHTKKCQLSLRNAFAQLRPAQPGLPVVSVCCAGAALTQCGLLRVEITCQCAVLSTAALNPISVSDDADHESKEVQLSCF